MKFVKSILVISSLLSFLSQAEAVNADLLQQYQYTMDQLVTIKSTQLDNRNSTFSFVSFDGQLVYGQISYPKQQATSYPVLIGQHAMGRSSQRWWVDSINGKKTITHVNELTKMANELGYVVIALDARAHGKRKNPDMSLTNIMAALSTGKDLSLYRHMILDTVKDHRVLLDWIQTQPQLDNNKIQLAGYSMGAQISLLLAAVDSRVTDVLAIVPPFVDEKGLVMISPMALASSLTGNRLMLITADEDKYATSVQNTQLFNAIASPNKHRAVMASGHILPESYLKHLENWFIDHKLIK